MGGNRSSIKRMCRWMFVPFALTALVVVLSKRDRPVGTGETAIPDPPAAGHPVAANHSGQRSQAVQALPDTEQHNLWHAFGEARRMVTPLTSREAAMPHNAGVTHFAQNPEQRLTLRFQAGSVRIGSGRSGSDWAVTMRLKGARQECARVAGTHVDFKHGEMVTEWWENRAEGIEHGFTLKAGHDLPRKPDGVIVRVAVTGLRVEKSAEGLRFVDAGSHAVLSYAGLKAWDARGAQLPATMSATEGAIELAVNDCGAVYPIVIDPLVVSLEGKGGPELGDGWAWDEFGYSVALDGNTALVGAHGDTTAAGYEAGSAYVFVRNGGTWVCQAKFEASDPEAYAEFGTSVALDGDTALVGAPFSDATWAGDAGAAYVFVRSGGLWSQQAKLQSTGSVRNDEFGHSVALDGDTALIGATWAINGKGAAYVFGRTAGTWNPQVVLEDVGGVGGDRFGCSVDLDNDTAIVGAYFDAAAVGMMAGSAHVFRKSSGIWSKEATLTPDDLAQGDKFGCSVALDGDTALVGADGDDTTSLPNPGIGKAYVFLRGGGSWSQQAKLVAPDGAENDKFGGSVALLADTALVGARGDDNNTGSAYLFERSAGSWSAQLKLMAGVGASDDYFGCSVALDMDMALIGAYGTTLASHLNVGRAYVFARGAGGWRLDSWLEAGDGAAGDYFGTSVALAGDTALIGAPGDDAAAGDDAGIAYVFLRSGGMWYLESKLAASDGAAGDCFGGTVALDEDTALVGSYRDDNWTGSAYVFVRNAAVWSEQAKLVANDAAVGDSFGYAVAIDGNTALAGAWLGDTPAGQDAGSAYVFTRNGTNWNQQAKLTANDGAAGDYFGWSTAIDGETALIGAVCDDTAAGQDAGSAHAFTRSGTNWTRQAKLVANDGAAGDYFGWSTALEGETALLGAVTDDTAAGQDAGSAHAFTRSGTNWNWQAKLAASVGATNGHFGNAIALDGDTALVGSYGDTVDGKIGAGSAFLFSRGTNGSWSQMSKLYAPDAMADDAFGKSVALDGDTALIGAQSDDEVNPFTGLTAAERGSVYVFRLSDGIPEIAVEQPPGTAILDAGGKDFGTVAVGSNTTLTFTIKNVGTGSLHGLSITNAGDNVADFVITAYPVAPVAGPSGSTTFSVRFSPSGSGTRTASIHILSNDADENPFDIALTGTGSATAYQLWLEANGLPMDCSGSGAPGFCFAHDGIPNLAKAGLNIAASIYGFQGRFATGMQKVGDKTYLAITYMRPDPAPTGFSYTAEISSNLKDWSSSNTVEVSNTSLGDLRTIIVRDSQAMQDFRSRFIRLRITGY